MTSEELEALEKLEKAATPGPWYGCFDYIVTADDEPIAEYFGNDADCEFIVLLRDAAPALIAAARENADLRAKLAAAEKALDDQAEAVRVLAHEISEWRLAHVCSPVSLIDAPIIRARKRTASNPTAAAAVKEAGGG
jgi:hypothetical protein